MMVAALVANGHDPQEMPLSSTGRPYGVTHKHHPCTLWAGESNGNFRWLGELGLALCEEYEYRKKSSLMRSTPHWRRQTSSMQSGH